MTDTKRRIELADAIGRYHTLKLNQCIGMSFALHAFEKGDEKHMYHNLLFWANAQHELDEWWDNHRFDYLRMTEVVGGWK